MHIPQLLLQLLLICQVIEIHSFAQVFALRQTRQNTQPHITMQMDRRDIFKKTLGVGSLISYSNFLASAYAYMPEEINQINLYDKALPSVCYISTEYMNNTQNTQKNTPKGVGTGFLWDKEGHIVTNFHVINKADKAMVYMNNKNGSEIAYNVKLCGVDPDKDIAVLKISANHNDTFIPITLAENKDILIGQYAYAIGNPFGQSYSFSMGIISGKHRELTSPTGRKIKDVIQTDAAINPGNSGGVLLNTDGNLIGMNTATIGMGTSSGVNLAISVDTIRKSVPDIIKYGNAKRAVLGIEYLERNPSLEDSQKSGMPFIEKGVIVKNVPATSPAYAAGLRGIQNNQIGDIIIGINTYDIDTARDLLDILDKYKPNDVIQMRVLRSNQFTPVSLQVTLGSFEVYNFSGLEYEKR